MAARAATIPADPTADLSPIEEKVRQQSQEFLPLEQQIRRRAHEIYLEHGGQDGSDLDDWLQAEAEILAAQEKEA